MYRFVKMSGTWYGLEIDEELYSDVDSILAFVYKGSVVSICDDIETFADEMGIDTDDIVMWDDDQDEG